jgi:hypothetical protein
MKVNFSSKERVFTVTVDGVEKKYKIVKPTFTQGNKADLLYKKSFGEAIKSGLMTAMQMREIMAKDEYYGNSTNTSRDIDNELAKLTADLEQESDKDKSLSIVLAIKEQRARKYIENFKINSMYEQTADNYAESIRNQFYASELTQDEGGKKIFKSFDDFCERQADNIAQEAILNFMLFNAKISENYELSLPENQWLLKNGYINEKGESLKTADTEVEVAGNNNEVKESSPAAT